MSILRTGGWRLRNRDAVKVAILTLLVLLSMGATYYVHCLLHIDLVVTHLFYVPIVLAGFWWGKRAIWVAVLLGGWNMACSALSPLDISYMTALLRFGMFIPVSLAVVTLRKQGLKTEGMLRETRNYLENLLNYANAPIIVWDPGFRITQFNHAFERLTGYIADEVIGKELSVLFPEASRGESLIKIGRTLAGEYWESVEIPILRKDGNVRLALWNSANIYAEDGTTLLATIAQGQDITERKRAEEALQESEEKYRTTFESTGTATVIVEEDTTLSMVNSQFEKLCGYSREEIEGKKSWTEFVVKDDLERMKEYHRLRRIAEDAVPGSYEFRFIDRYGAVKNIFLTIAVIPGTKKSVASLLDITERKQAEERLRLSFIRLAETVSRAMESHDPYTAGHQRKVTELAKVVGEKMGLDQDRLLGLYIAGLLHDIGKISIPTEILTHPGKLSDVEWALIRSHPRRGYEILKETEFPWPIAEIALHHHERLDGSGYPGGLKGDDLSLEVRILAACDVVDAMSSHRPYRPARSKEEVMEELRSGRGTRYDPQVVDNLLALLKEGKLDHEV